MAEGGGSVDGVGGAEDEGGEAEGGHGADAERGDEGPLCKVPPRAPQPVDQGHEGPTQDGRPAQPCPHLKAQVRAGGLRQGKREGALWV